MCGILGIISSTIHQEQFETALCQLAHRGPDGKGVFYDSGIAFGHTRLAIQDLSENAKQPMNSSDNRYTIIFNGEIYNHLEIRDTLISNRFKFNSSSDTETILYGYIHYGQSLVSIIDGNFSFAIYDHYKKEVFAARDAFGVKPFYYYHENNELIFSSEIKSILKLQSSKNILNPNTFYQSLILQYSIGDLTGFEGIKKLKPGHQLVISLDKVDEIKITKWSTEVYTGVYEIHNEKKWIEILDNALNLAVKKQLLSDKPIAYFLSGGLDSSLLVAIAHKIAPEKVSQAFCIDAGPEFKKEGFGDDRHFAIKVAKQLGISLELINVKSDFLKTFDEMIYSLEEPQGDIAPEYVKQISKAAVGKGYNVLISGTGGDDVFSGYRRHLAISKDGIIDKTPIQLKKIVKNVIEQLPVNNQTRRIKKLVKNIDLSSRNRFYQYFFWADKMDVFNLFNDELKKQINTNQIEELYEEHLAEIPLEKNKLNQMLHLEQATFLPNHNLNYTDKLGMSESVEVRVPYLDKDLIAIAATIPPDLKLKGITPKYLLKKVAEKYLPKEVIYRKKTGFGAPIAHWFQDKNLQKEISKRLQSDSLKSAGIFDIDQIMLLFEDSIAQRKDNSYTILSLLAIESWIRQFAKP